MNEETERREGQNFIEAIIEKHNKTNKYDGKVQTRFPPEPNGYLHIGHAKSININFGFAKQYGGKCNLRFDDTNPSKEEVEYVKSIKEDVKWLGFDWEDRLYFASDYFEQFHQYAIDLIKKGLAYVDDLTPEQIREFRGTLTTPGKESPNRGRSIEDNLELFEKMKGGEFANGEKTLRAKIDMTSPNMNMRDPVLYRILHESHHRTGDKWCIYPMYDWAHGLEDSIEGITHSICTLEFEDHRPLYDWFLDNLGIHHPQQIEFARLNMTYTIMSKRKLLKLVEGKHVSGWDDPRMPTISGMRRRGFPPEAIREFSSHIGVSKSNSTVDIEYLEFFVREQLNRQAPRIMAVLNPLKIIITNYPEDKEEILESQINPEKPELGLRKIPFSRELYIEQEDFMEEPMKKFYRMAPGRELRFRNAYFITCNEVIKDDNGGIKELHCTYDPETKGGNAPDGRKSKATLHWVSAKHAVRSTVRLYKNLFTTLNPDDTEEGQDFTINLNPDSLKVLEDTYAESGAKEIDPGTVCQFERLGYFCVDIKDSSADNLVFNRVVTLRDTWAKIKKKMR
ncbi:glutamine--tRNA ligase/YqeY domain fusion protein [bacterium]|nr:glutamine--tRNA ligase/YqeY domain fusion protein [bacterium]